MAAARQNTLDGSAFRGHPLEVVSHMLDTALKRTRKGELKMTGSPKPLIAGNWKMHGSEVFAADLAGSLADRMAGHGGGEAWNAAVSAGAIGGRAGGRWDALSGVAIGGQDCHTWPSRAPYRRHRGSDAGGRRSWLRDRRSFRATR